MHYGKTIIALKGILMELCHVKNKKGRFFAPHDTFHPIWCGFIRLLYETGHPIKYKKLWPNVLDLLNFKEYTNFHSSNEITREGYLKKHKNDHYIQVWAPFLEKGISLNESLNQWASNDLITIDLDLFKKKNPNITEEEIDNLYQRDILFLKETFNSIFSWFGELYNNSITHGINSETNPANDSHMTGFIASNKDGSLDIFHADLGMTIVKNIKENVPTKVRSLPDKEIMRWATIHGNTSKDKKIYPASGGGITVLKLVAMFPNNYVTVISGKYQVTFSNDKDIDEIESYDDIKTQVERLDFEYPGTCWLIHVNKIDHLKNIEETKKNMKEIEKLQKKIQDEVENLIKEYII